MLFYTSHSFQSAQAAGIKQADFSWFQAFIFFTEPRKQKAQS